MCIRDRSLIESKHFGLPCLTFTELDAFNNIYSEEVIVVLPDREDYTVSDILIKLLTAQWEIRNTLISNFLPWLKITSKSINIVMNIMSLFKFSLKCYDYGLLLKEITAKRKFSKWVNLAKKNEELKGYKKSDVCYKMCIRDSQLSGLQVTTTIDPVFLLNAEDWLKVAEKPVVNEPYILCYFIGSEKKYNDLVNLIKQETGYKVVHLNVNLQSHVKADYEFRDVHPQKFVGYIANASYVLTNSFHCTAFSIIFKKSLKFILKPQGNSRVRCV